MKYDALLINAGTGNLLSVYNALRSLGFNILVTNNPKHLTAGERIILPGVGAFGNFMEGLSRHNLTAPLIEAAQRGDPLFGICVGMQAFFEYGEELGQTPGLNLLPGIVPHFPPFKDKKVPQTGWNQISFERSSQLFQKLNPGDYTYFNLSYYCAPDDPLDTIGTTDYGIPFTSIVQRDNVFGVQFHPEKSQHVGLTILNNFMNY